MMHKTILMGLLISAIIAGRAGSRSYQFLGNVTAFKQQDDILDLRCTNARLQITILADDLFRIRLTTDEQFPEDRSYSVLPISRTPAIVSIEDLGTTIKIATPELTLVIQKSPCRLAFYDRAGQLICKDHDSYGLGWSGHSVCCWKEWHDEAFYGLGEKTRGLNKKGHSFVMWNSDIPGYSPTFDPLYQSHPFFIALHQGRAFGIYFDNSFRSQFNFGAGTDQFFSFGADDGEMDYYLIYGPEFSKVLERYGELVGKMPLPPKWSLGYQQCRWSYYPDSEVMALAHKFRQKQIPCDVIYLDIHYMDGYRVFTWHPERFSAPRKMLEELKNMGFKVAVIIDPGIKVDPNYHACREGIAGDHFCKYPDGRLYQGQVWPGWCYFPDFSQPAARDWFGRLYQSIIDEGVLGFWNDMNEPATWGGTFPDIVQFDNEGRGADHRQMHNLYGMLMARSTYEGVRKIRPNQRPFVLTRAGFAGVQRYAAVWTGDNVASWEHLKLSMAMCLGLGLSGVAFCGMDVGGFMGAPTPELYTRWLQLGTFTPLFRTHTCIDTPDQEPWSFGDRYEEINKRFIELRYQFLPYLYQAFYEAATKNKPIMRPLVFDFQTDPNTIGLDDQFLLGSDLLIAPVYQENQVARRVYFPAGDWYDFWTDEKISGPAERLVSAPIDRIPIFVKAGAMLPMAETQQYVDQRKTDPLILRIYPQAGNWATVLYEDDGLSYDFETGGYCQTTFQLSVAVRKIVMQTLPRQGRFNPGDRSYQVHFHALSGIPRQVKLNQRSMNEVISSDRLRTETSGWFFDRQTNQLLVKYPDTGQQIHLELTF